VGCRWVAYVAGPLAAGRAHAVIGDRATRVGALWAHLNSRLVCMILDSIPRAARHIIPRRACVPSESTQRGVSSLKVEGELSLHRTQLLCGQWLAAKGSEGGSRGAGREVLLSCRLSRPARLGARGPSALPAPREQGGRGTQRNHWLRFRLPRPRSGCDSELH